MDGLLGLDRGIGGWGRGLMLVNAWARRHVFWIAEIVV